MKQTNIEQIRQKAIEWVKLPIDFKNTTYGNLIHPVFENKITFNPETNSLIDISNKSDYDNICNLKIECIQEETNACDIFYFIRKPYRTDFFKYVADDLSSEDFSVILSHIWIHAEAPNRDSSISIQTFISWFKRADKKYLMEPEDYEYYQNLSDTVQVYRGVGKYSNPNGISWTTDIKTAKWFATRFDKGYVIKGTVNKKDILSYFDQRNEKECIIDPNCILDKKRI